jgi:hypothetical protein
MISDHGKIFSNIVADYHMFLVQHGNVDDHLKGRVIGCIRA